MRKFLILGSAGYIKDWYAQNWEKYQNDGYILCAINNAWAVDPNKLTVWFRSADYFEISKRTAPPQSLRVKWVENSFVKTHPFFYKKSKDGTMLLNVLCHLLNDAFYNKIRIKVAIAGSDLIYRRDETDHFYGKGTADPMRIKKEDLAVALDEIKRRAAELKCSILNVGGDWDFFNRALKSKMYFEHLSIQGIALRFNGHSRFQKLAVREGAESIKKEAQRISDAWNKEIYCRCAGGMGGC